MALCVVGVREVVERRWGRRLRRGPYRDSLSPSFDIPPRGKNLREREGAGGRERTTKSVEERGREEGGRGTKGLPGQGGVRGTGRDERTERGGGRGRLEREGRGEVQRQSEGRQREGEVCVCPRVYVCGCLCRVSVVEDSIDTVFVPRRGSEASTSLVSPRSLRRETRTQGARGKSGGERRAGETWGSSDLDPTLPPPRRDHVSGPGRVPRSEGVGARTPSSDALEAHQDPRRGGHVGSGPRRLCKHPPALRHRTRRDRKLGSGRDGTAGSSR